MRWLITGGCGFIGRNLITDLLRGVGHSLRIVDDLSVGSREGLASVCEFTEVFPERIGAGGSEWSGVELVEGDVCDDRLALNVVRDADVIVHLAASTGVGPSVEDPRADCRTNVIGTLNYLEAARQRAVQRFVFASSSAPIGECEPPIHEELAARPVSPYGASKLAGEGYCSAFYRSFGVETVALRFGNVYGPRSEGKSSVVARFITRALHGDPLEVFGDGHQTRDFIHVTDLVGAIRKAATVPGVGGEVFQIATQSETTILELAEILSELLQEAGVGELPLRHASARVGDVRRSFSDTTKARERLGWTAERDLWSGLEQTLEWFLHALSRADDDTSGEPGKSFVRSP